MISYISVILRLMYRLLLGTIVLVTRMRFQLESCVIYISFFYPLYGIMQMVFTLNSYLDAGRNSILCKDFYYD